METEKPMKVTMSIMDFSPCQTPYAHLHVTVENGPTRVPGISGDFPASTTFTFKWRKGVKAFTYYEIQNEEIGQEGDELFQEGKPWPQHKIKLLLSISSKPFTSGGFGGIWKGLSNRGMTLAIKKMKAKPGNNSAIPPEAIMAAAYFEAAIASTFKHKNVMELLNIVPQVNNPPWLVFQFMENGSLCKLLGQLENDYKMRITRGIVDGMVYLHNNLFIHRDLNPRNILIDSDYSPKIADFGLSAFLDGKASGFTTYSKERGFAGENFRRNHYSLLYCAPEVLPVPLVVTMPEDDELGDAAIAEFINEMHLEATSSLQPPATIEAVDLLEQQEFEQIFLSSGVSDEEEDTGGLADFIDSLHQASINVTRQPIDLENNPQVIQPESVADDAQDITTGSQVPLANYMTSDQEPTTSEATQSTKPKPPEFLSKERKKRETVTLGPEAKYSFKSDVWSFGLIVHEIWTDGESKPYSNVSYQKIKKRIQKCSKDVTYFSLFKDPKTCTKYRAEGICECPHNLCKIIDPDQELVDQEEYPRIFELLQKIFKYNPKRRPAFNEIKKMLDKITL